MKAYPRNVTASKLAKEVVNGLLINPIDRIKKTEKGRILARALNMFMKHKFVTKKDHARRDMGAARKQPTRRRGGDKIEKMESQSDNLKNFQGLPGSNENKFTNLNGDIKKDSDKQVHSHEYKERMVLRYYGKKSLKDFRKNNIDHEFNIIGRNIIGQNRGRVIESEAVEDYDVSKGDHKTRRGTLDVGE